MSTHAIIIAKTSDNSYRSIYLHFDGYPQSALSNLRLYYNTQEAVDNLMTLGNLSVLGKSARCPEGHSFDTPKRGYCVAFGRDRGEEDQHARAYGTLQAALNDASERFWAGDSWEIAGG